MNLDSKGLTFLKNREGLRLDAYLDVAGVPTIGYGTTIYAGGKKVKLGDKISQIQAEHYLVNDLHKFEKAVSEYTNLDPLRDDNHDITTPAVTQNMYNALVALCYNIGSSAYKTSTVAKYVSSDKRFNTMFMGKAFLMWNKISFIRNGVKVYEVSPGLVNRRNKEIELYFS